MLNSKTASDGELPVLRFGECGVLLKLSLLSGPRYLGFISGSNRTVQFIIIIIIIIIIDIAVCKLFILDRNT